MACELQYSVNMGNLDAPKAPAGWYQIEDGKPGEKYWDGNAWTNQTRGLVSNELAGPESSAEEKPSSNRSLLWIGIGIAFFVLIIFIASGGKGIETDAQKKQRIKEAAEQLLVEQNAQAGQQSVETAPKAPNVPDGFIDMNNGVGYKFVDAPCEFGRCVHYQIYAYGSCPTSVYIEGNQVDNNDVAYGITNDMLGPMNPGDNAVATLQATESAASGVKVTKVECY